MEEATDGHIVEVRGFSCKQGERYALQEHRAPQRMVTTTVQIAQAIYTRLPVRTDQPVPKGVVGKLCQLLRNVAVVAPIRQGQIVVPNVLDLGVNIIASRTMAAL